MKDGFVDIGGPTVISTPCKGRMDVLTTLRYEHVSFLLCDGRVYGLIVAVPNSRTRRGVGIGDDLSRAERTYSSLKCGEALYGEAIVGEQPSYPYCVGKLRRGRWIWFGRDPVRSITVAATPLRS